MTCSPACSFDLFGGLKRPSDRGSEYQSNPRVHIGTKPQFEDRTRFCRALRDKSRTNECARLPCNCKKVIVKMSEECQKQSAMKKSAREYRALPRRPKNAADPLVGCEEKLELAGGSSATAGARRGRSRLRAGNCRKVSLGQVRSVDRWCRRPGSGSNGRASSSVGGWAGDHVGGQVGVDVDEDTTGRSGPFSSILEQSQTHPGSLALYADGNLTVAGDAEPPPVTEIW